MARRGKEEIEFVECSSLSISYDASGKATVSFTVIRNDKNDLGRDYNRYWGNLGGVNFTDGNVMSAVQQPFVGSGGWNQWQLQWEGVGK